MFPSVKAIIINLEGIYPLRLKNKIFTVIVYLAKTWVISLGSFCI